MRTPRWLLDCEVADPPGDGPAVLLFDIETAPQNQYGWGEGKYSSRPLKVWKTWYVLSVVYKWLGSDETHWVSIFQDPKYKPDYPWTKHDPHKDRYVIGRLWHLFDKADVLIGHNGDKFDIKKVNTRILLGGAPPPSPSKSIDTLKEARRHFAFSSNSLNRLSQELGFGEKLHHAGMDTWWGCMEGDPEMWQLMEEYNRKDVELLELLYVKLLPWVGAPGKANPGVNATRWSRKDRPVLCPKVGCGGGKLVARGKLTTAAGLRYQRWQCAKCSGYSQSRYRDREYLDGPKVK